MNNLGIQVILCRFVIAIHLVPLRRLMMRIFRKLVPLNEQGNKIALLHKKIELQIQFPVE